MPSDWALDGDLGNLLRILVHRLGGSDNSAGTAVSIVDWLNRVSHWNSEVFGGWTQVASVTGLVILCLQLPTVLTLDGSTAHGPVPVHPVWDPWR